MPGEVTLLPTFDPLGSATRARVDLAIANFAKVCRTGILPARVWIWHATIAQDRRPADYPYPHSCRWPRNDPERAKSAR